MIQSQNQGMLKIHSVLIAIPMVTRLTIICIAATVLSAEDTSNEQPTEKQRKRI